MKRTQLNIVTGEIAEITVIAYKNASDEVLLLDEGVQAPEGYTVISDEKAAELTKPVPQPINKVSMRQARLALLGAGYLGSVQAALDSLESPMKEAAQIEWEYATDVERDSQLVQMLTPALGLTDAQLDELFEVAATL